MTDDDQQFDPGVPQQRAFTDDDALEVVDTSASCQHCAHVDVCGYVNRFTKAADEVANTQDPVIDVMDMARICDAYVADD